MAAAPAPPPLAVKASVSSPSRGTITIIAAPAEPLPALGR